jgi:UDP-galactopyranose mutase
MKYDFVVVGSGLAGAVFAERVSTVLKKKVLIIEKRAHIGGNIYDYYNTHGILIHKYGPHIFRTNSKEVWDYLSDFTRWHFYQHRVLANVLGQEVPFPINLDTYNTLMNENLSVDDFKEKIKHNKIKENSVNAEEEIINQVGKFFYENFFKNYSIKQWGKHPQELDADTVKRVPVRTDKENRYFFHKYQGLPLYGYTKMIQKMLFNDNVSILLNTDYKKIINDLKYDYLIYTGPVDYFFDHKFGELEYRSLNFEEHTFDQSSFQSCSVINYPNNYDFTRITEYKKLTGQIHHKTTVHYEYPVKYKKDINEPYYPFLDKDNSRIKQRYLNECSKMKNIIFVGRLGEYKYYAMDEIVEHCLKIFKEKF